jgi:hypothetical protein
MGREGELGKVGGERKSGLAEAGQIGPEWPTRQRQGDRRMDLESADLRSAWLDEGPGAPGLEVGTEGEGATVLPDSTGFPGEQRLLSQGEAAGGIGSPVGPMRAGHQLPGGGASLPSNRLGEGEGQLC